MSKDSALIELEGITVAYARGPVILDGVDFTLGHGDRVGIIGPNGSGKTTLFLTIMGLVKPAAGRMRFRGKPLQTERDFQAVRRNVGFLFQNSDDQLFCPTVLEDVAFGPLNLGKSPDEARDISLRILDALGLGESETRISHKLSHGEKKLVALASVLAMEPEALILDEPTAGLDQKTKDRLTHILGELSVSLIISSHEMEFLSRMTDTFFALTNGRIEPARSVIPHTHVHVHAGGQYDHEHEDPYR
ncbi:MAG: ABC transporter ATP-binding protein [Desulfomonilia bacterium]|nr:ABC transporter ATP-binding protein [Desulfomonilia bacterium]